MQLYISCFRIKLKSFNIKKIKINNKKKKEKIKNSSLKMIALTVKTLFEKSEAANSSSVEKRVS